MRKNWDEIRMILSRQTGSPGDYLLKKQIPITGGVLYEVEHIQAAVFDQNYVVGVIALDSGEVFHQWYWHKGIPHSESEIAEYEWNVPGVLEKVPMMNGLPHDPNYVECKTLPPSDMQSDRPETEESEDKTPMPVHELPFEPFSEDNYQNPPIPFGYEYITGKWNSGYVIRRMEDLSEFVWIPVGTLPADGEQDGSVDGVKFGTRSYGYSGVEFAKACSELTEQYGSVQKYGGFYISRYPASVSDRGICVFDGNRKPWTGLNKMDAIAAASGFEKRSGIRSHLTYAAEMDSVLCWLLQKGTLQMEEIRDACGRRDRRDANRSELVPSKQDIFRDGLYGICGCADEWTQEMPDDSFLKGCGSKCSWPSATGCYYRPYACYAYMGFRVVLSIR